MSGAIRQCSVANVSAWSHWSQCRPTICVKSTNIQERKVDCKNCLRYIPCTPNISVLTWHEALALGSDWSHITTSFSTSCPVPKTGPLQVHKTASTPPDNIYIYMYQNPSNLPSKRLQLCSQQLGTSGGTFAIAAFTVGNSVVSLPSVLKGEKSKNP